MSQFVASPFKNPQYRNLFMAQVTSLLGSGLTTIALALLAYKLAPERAGEILGFTLGLKMVAYVLIAPIAGGFAHLLPRKATLVFLDVSRALLLMVIPFIQEIWQMYILIFTLNMFSACFTPIFQAIIPDLLPNEKRYTKALSYSRLAYDLENLLSPSLAALILTFTTFETLFNINGITFFLSALIVFLTLIPKNQLVERDRSILNNMTFGIRAYLKTPRLRGLLALHLTVACGGAMVIVNSVVYVKSYLGLDENALALAYMASGFGSMLIALLLPRILNEVPERPVMIIGACVISSALLFGFILPDYNGLLVIWFLLGCGWSLIQTPAARLITKSSSSGDRTAFFSANFALSHACWFIGYLLAGWIAANIGLSHSFSLLATLAFFATLWALKFWPASDPVAMEHVHPEHIHNHPHYHKDPHHQHDHEGWEGAEPHIHEHRHPKQVHTHTYVIDAHHASWPQR